jgi:hypothetical protein
MGVSGAANALHQSEKGILFQKDIVSNEVRLISQTLYNALLRTMSRLYFAAGEQ